MEIKVKKLSPNAKLPTHGSEFSAGYDLHACFDGYENKSVVIEPNETVKIPTGLAMTLPNGYFGAIFARSGLAIKQGLRLSNSVAVIDPDYTGNYIVALHNDSNERRIINDGDRIAQLVLIPFMNMEFEIVDELEETERGAGGFGSTGIN